MKVKTKKSLEFNVMLTANIIIKKIQVEPGPGKDDNYIQESMLRSAYGYAKLRGIEPFISCYFGKFVYDMTSGNEVTVNCLCRRDDIETMKFAISESLNDLAEIKYIIFTVHDASGKYMIDDKISEIHTFIYENEKGE